MILKKLNKKIYLIATLLLLALPSIVAATIDSGGK